MSSKLPHEYLDAADMTMLQRVLEQAGYSATQPDTSETLEAAKFLLCLVRQGTINEEELTLALRNRDRGIAAGIRMPTEGDSLVRWTDDDGRAATSLIGRMLIPRCRK